MKRSIVLLSALLVVGCDGEEGRCNDSSSHGRVSPGHDEHGDPPDGEEDDRCETNDDGPDGAVVAPVDAAGVDATRATADAGANPGCRMDRDCAAAGAGLVCEMRAGACVTPTQCATDASCAAGEHCLAGRCLGASAICQFATDCGAGRDCVDGRCLSACGASASCPSTQVCVAGYCDRPSQPGSECARSADCASGSVCADGRCVAGCAPDRPCAAGGVCVLGFCQADTAPRSFCVRDADCAAGSVCRRGSCRASCRGGTAAECLRVDVTFDTCGSDLLCTNPLEMRPECARSADCAAQTLCINARCR